MDLWSLPPFVDRILKGISRMRINKEQVQENMKDSECVLINVLSKSEYKKMHIKGSESFPLTDDHSAFTKEVGDKFGKRRTSSFTASASASWMGSRPRRP